MTRSLSLSIAGLVRNWAGDYDEASRLQAEGLLLARERGLLLPLLFSCFMRGLTMTGKGDYDEALGSFTEGLSLAERIGDEAIHHRLLNCLGWLYADLGDLDHAERLNATSAQIGRRRRDPGGQPNAELNLAEIFAARGDLARAQDLVRRRVQVPEGSVHERVDAVPLFDSDVRRHGRTGGCAGRPRGGATPQRRVSRARDSHQLTEESGEGVAARG